MAEKLKLHESISVVLLKKEKMNRSATIKEIAREINRRGL
jgi:hypothetical protein